MNVYISPSEISGNKYIELTKYYIRDIAKSVKGANELKIKNIFDRSSNVIILNWFDDYSYNKKKKRISLLRTFSIFIKLIVFKILCGKVIYVKHNYKPHGMEKMSALYVFIQTIISLFSTKTIAHSTDVNDADYIPHPLYISDDSFVSLDREGKENEFLIFGGIDKYKDIDGLLQVWPENRHLKIFGRCKDPELIKRIESIIDERSLDIEWKNAFITDDELNAVLTNTQTVIVNNLESSMIVSGVFFHAISYKCNVLIRDSRFSRFVVDRYNLAHEFNYSNITSYLDSYQWNSSVGSECVIMNNGENVIKTCWKRLLLDE